MWHVARCLDDAMSLFARISKKNIFSFSIALVALDHHGELQAVHELWKIMEAPLK